MAKVFQINRVYENKIKLKTPEKEKYCDITPLVQKEIDNAVKNYGMDLTSGIGFLMSRHTTGSVFINEYEEALLKDLKETFTPLILVKKILFRCEHGRNFHHGCKECNSTCDRDNAPAHIKTVWEGTQIFFNIEDGRLRLGTHQRLFFGEHDGPRDRELKIKIIGR